MKYVGVFITSKIDSELNSRFRAENSPCFDDDKQAREWLETKAEMFNQSHKTGSKEGVYKIKHKVMLAIDEKQSDADFDRLLNFFTTYLS